MSTTVLYKKAKKIFKCQWYEESIVNAVIDALLSRLDPESARLLNRNISGERCAFFVGAGASVESGLPTFDEFSKHILAATLPRRGDITKDDMAMFVSELRPEVLVQTLHEFYGSKVFDFYKWFEGAKPSTYHYALAKSLRQGNLVLTTNVDTLIEDAYIDLYGEIDFVLLVTNKDFEEFSRERLFTREGVLIKLHGTIESLKTGLSRYDSVRFLLEHVGEGGTTSMRSLLTYICRKFDMIYLGYSGCDSFSVLPVLCDVATSHATLWLWHDGFTRRSPILDKPETNAYETEQRRIGELLVFEGKSFDEIPRGMESLSTCEILSARQCAFRCRGDISWIMYSAVPEHRVRPRSMIHGPTPAWVHDISVVAGIRCAARLYAMLGRLDMAISLLIEADRCCTDEREKALILKELGNQYVNKHLSASYEKALKCLEEAKTIFHELGDYEKLLDTQLDIADILRQMMHLDQADEILLILEDIFEQCGNEAFVQKAMVRHGLIKGLILGIGRADFYSKDLSVVLLDEIGQTAADMGFVSLHAAILNASCLIKYQMAGQSVERLESVAIDLETAVHLNLIIGDYRSSFQQLRIVGVVKMDLFRLKKDEEMINEGIRNFRRAEKILFRLSRNQILGELLEIRFRLGDALIKLAEHLERDALNLFLSKAEHLEEAERILLDVQIQYIRLKDWHNEALTLELLVKTESNPNDLTERCMKIKAIYEDAKTNEKIKARLKIEPHIRNRGRYILRTAANKVRAQNEELAIELQKLMVDAFVD